MKIKPSQNREITLSLTGVGKSCPGCEFLRWQVCLFVRENLRISSFASTLLLWWKLKNLYENGFHSVTVAIKVVLDILELFT